MKYTHTSLSYGAAWSCKNLLRALSKNNYFATISHLNWVLFLLNLISKECVKSVDCHLFYIHCLAKAARESVLDKTQQILRRRYLNIVRSKRNHVVCINLISVL
jgi:hypothetical protein